MERRDVRSIVNNYMGLFGLVGKLKQIGARDEVGVGAEATGKTTSEMRDGLCESLYMIGSVENEPSLWWTMSRESKVKVLQGVREWVEGKGKAKAGVRLWRFGFFYRICQLDNADQCGTRARSRAGATSG